MTTLATPVIRLATRRAATRFDEATRDPMGAQLAKLRALVDKNRDTEYGRAHDFASIKSFDDWRRAVPIVDYEAIRDPIARMTRGERGILTAEDPVMFSQTSGTTGAPKLIPVTPTCLGSDHADTMRTWLHHADKAHPGIFQGQILSLVSPAVEGNTESGLPYGATSGHIYLNMSWIVRQIYAVPYDVFTIKDYPSKYYIVLRLALDADVSMLCTANPSSIVKICEVANERSAELIRDIRDGTIRDESLNLPEVDPAVLADLRACVEPNPERADELERACERREGRLVPADYWPNLAMVGCWKGGTVKTALGKLGEWFGAPGFDGPRAPTPIRDLGYLSSEARCSVPLTDDGAGGVLAVGTNLYEFVDVQEIEDRPDDRASWKVVDASQLATDREYYVLVTTAGGLYRYDMNDVIAVAGKYNETPIIEFKRKGRDVTSITGEKVTANQVIEAFESSTASVSTSVEHFKAEADEQESRYAFKIECAQPLTAAAKHELLQTIDQRLGELNIEYASKRKSDRLHAPVLLVMKEGWHEELKKGDLRDFQRKGIKLSALSDGDKDFVAECVTLDGAKGGG